jgi:hypothetical protein
VSACGRSEQEVVVVVLPPTKVEVVALVQENIAKDLT